MLPKSVAVRQRKGQRHKSGEAELLTQRLMCSIDKVKVTLNAKWVNFWPVLFSTLLPSGPYIGKFKIGQIEYCKSGYFRWGKIRRKLRQDISHGGNFHDTAPISFIKAYGFYFCVGVIFAKKTKAWKTRKIPPRENFPRLQYIYNEELYNEMWWLANSKWCMGVCLEYIYSANVILGKFKI